MTLGEKELPIELKLIFKCCFEIPTATKRCNNFQQEPEEIILSQRAEYRMVRGRQKLRIVKETFHYIPILKTLQALLGHPEVLSEVSKILRTVLVC